MIPPDAKSAFLTFLVQQGLKLEGMTLPEAMDAMSSFYLKVRPGAGVADGLVFRWGTYFDMGEGDRFEAKIARPQTKSRYQSKQVELRFSFEATPTLVELGQGECWCRSPSELSGFRHEVERQDAYRVPSGRSDGKLELRLVDLSD